MYTRVHDRIFAPTTRRTVLFRTDGGRGETRYFSVGTVVRGAHEGRNREATEAREVTAKTQKEEGAALRNGRKGKFLRRTLQRISLGVFILLFYHNRKIYTRGNKINILLLI